jgi:hypothetical protein
VSDWRPTAKQLEAITGASTLRSCPETVTTYGLPDPEYRGVGAVNNSFLKLMDPMPGSAISFFDGGDKPQFRIGRYVHQGVLTPHDPVPQFVVIPSEHEDGTEWRPSSNKAELWVSRQRAAGFEVFSQTDYLRWSGCIRSLSANPEIQTYLAAGHPEVSCFAVVEVDGVRFRMKTRIDWVPTGRALLNFKTTVKGGSSRYAFGREVLNGYGMQAAVELMVWNLCNPGDQRDTYVWPVVEKEPPYCISFFFADNNTLSRYRDKLALHLQTFADCVRNGVFPGDNQVYQLV